MCVNESRVDIYTCIFLNNKNHFIFLISVLTFLTTLFFIIAHCVRLPVREMSSVKICFLALIAVTWSQFGSLKEKVGAESVAIIEIQMGTLPKRKTQQANHVIMATL